MKKDMINKKTDLLSEYYTKEKIEKEVSLLANLFKESRKARIEYYKQNPIDAPNEVLNSAIIEGIGINNDFVLSTGEYQNIFKIGIEEFYCWTNEKDNFSKLVVKVDPLVKEKDFWKTAVAILEIAFSFSKELEVLYEFDYDWIYRFDNSMDIDKLHYLKSRYDVSNSISIVQVTDFSQIASLIELLERDDKFFVACQNIIAAKKNHEFCQICALTPEHLRKHNHFEPEIWEKASLVPKLEAAIVQATRSVEAILGKPGNRETASKLARTKKRWLVNIDLNPDDKYELAGKSYLDYYYDLFSLRGFAAHSFGELSFNMKRIETIEAQSFAWIIIIDYYRKHSIDENKALQRMSFNLDMLKRFDGVNVLSKCTKDSKYAP